MLPVIVSCSNFGYLDFCENLLTSISRNAPSYNVVFYCLDSQIFESLSKKHKNPNFTFEVFNTNVTNEYSSYGSSNFNKITFIKIQIILESLSKYQYIHFVDSDVVFLKEPSIEYYEKYTDYDIVFQKDAPHTPPEKFTTWTCTGNFVLKNTEETRNLLSKIIEYHSNNLHLNDQDCLMKILDSESIADIREYKYAKLYQFPPQDFVCGFYVRDPTPRDYHVDYENAMVFHANHVSGKDGKIELLKRIGGWYNLK
jgi:lipopolysaccharide biosynthesis glycosyltransferase